MKIVVIGGSGLIGSKVVGKLRQLGHDAVSASPDSGVNTVTGEGLAQALAGAQVVVDVANSPSFEDQAVLRFFGASGRNLLAAEEVAGVKHHVALSVVGTDRLLESGYFRGKMLQELLIAASAIPYTIVRSTQFFEFLRGIVLSATDAATDAATAGRVVRLSPALVQPIASDDVAASVVNVVLDVPVNGIVEIAGPERVRLSELVGRYLHASSDEREVVADPRARYFGVELSDRSLVPGDDARLGEIRFEEWLSRAPAQEPASRGGSTRSLVSAGR